MESDFVSEAQRLAETSFASGFYCAESVILALTRAQGLENDILPKAATAFCSGMARTGGACGALTGAVMGISLALGRNEARESVQPAYAAIQQLVRAFEQAFGATGCRDLLGCDLGTPEGQHKFRDEKLHEQCASYTRQAAGIAARIIADHRALPIEPVTEITQIKRILAACDLPVADVSPSESLLFFGCRSGSELAGLVGLELAGPSVALLRSLAVLPQFRNHQLGKSLVAFAQSRAAALGARSLFLLTTSAQGYFSRLGYAVTPREDAPPAIRATAQFSGLCPATSSFMSKRLPHGSR